jgi:hypothetical protein
MTKSDPARKPAYHPSFTVKERIAAGPKFEDDPDGFLCVACGDEGDVDATTGLCRPCWRAHRWSPTAERLNPYAATAEATRDGT